MSVFRLLVRVSQHLWRQVPLSTLPGGESLTSVISRYAAISTLWFSMDFITVKLLERKHQKRDGLEFKSSRDFITLTPQILSDNYMSCCFRNLWLVSWSLPVKATLCHFVVPREGAQFKSPLLMSVFASGPRSWKAESRLPLLRGSVCHKGAPAEAQALEPPRQGQYGAQGRAV